MHLEIVKNTPPKRPIQEIRTMKYYVEQQGKALEQLFEDGLELITNLRSKMKNKLIPVGDKLLLGKRLMIETINDQLKNICHIEHSRQRSPVNFRVN